MTVVPSEQQTPGQQIVAQIRSPQFRDQVSLALPEDVRPERFVRAVVTALLANDDLQLSDQNALLTAALKAAQDGLLPDGREAAFVLFKGKAQYMPMVGGLRKIAAEHGWTLDTACVYEHDEFDYELGLTPRLKHRPARGDRGQLTFAYCVARHRDPNRTSVFEVMSKADIEERRKVARTQEVWSKWYGPMCEKTVAKAVFKRLPLDPADRRVASMLTDGIADPVAAVYGHRLIEGEIPPAGPGSRERAALPAGDTDTPREPGDSGEPAGQQAAADSPAPEPAAAPDDDAEPKVGKPAEQPAFQVPEAVLATAEQTVIPKGGEAKGRTLGEVAGELGGDEWIGWALARAASYWPAEFRAHLNVIAQTRFPQTWQSHVEQTGGTQ